MTPWERQRVELAIEQIESGRPHVARETLVLLLWNERVYHALLRNPRTERAARLARAAGRLLQGKWRDAA